MLRLQINQIKQICINRRNIEREYPQILIISLRNGVMGSVHVQSRDQCMIKHVIRV